VRERIGISQEGRLNVKGEVKGDEFESSAESFVYATDAFGTELQKRRQAKRKSGEQKRGSSKKRSPLRNLWDGGNIWRG